MARATDKGLHLYQSIVAPTVRRARSIFHISGPPLRKLRANARKEEMQIGSVNATRSAYLGAAAGA